MKAFLFLVAVLTCSIASACPKVQLQAVQSYRQVQQVQRIQYVQEVQAIQVPVYIESYAVPVQPVKFLALDGGCSSRAQLLGSGCNQQSFRSRERVGLFEGLRQRMQERRSTTRIRKVETIRQRN